MGTEPRINPDVVKRVDEVAQHWAAKHAPITVDVTNLPAVELCMKRLAALGEFLDRLHDEAFPHDPYMLGRLHTEMDRLGYGRHEEQRADMTDSARNAKPIRASAWRRF